MRVCLCVASAYLLISELDGLPPWEMAVLSDHANIALRVCVCVCVCAVSCGFARVGGNVAAVTGELDVQSGTVLP